MAAIKTLLITILTVVLPVSGFAQTSKVNFDKIYKGACRLAVVTASRNYTEIMMTEKFRTVAEQPFTSSGFDKTNYPTVQFSIRENIDAARFVYNFSKNRVSDDLLSKYYSGGVAHVRFNFSRTVSSSNVVTRWIGGYAIIANEKGSDEIELETNYFTIDCL